MALTSLQTPALQNLAVPAVCLLICFLAYSSQYLFYHLHLDPGALTTKEALWLNILVAATCWSYERACRVDPGRLPNAIYQAGLEEQPPSDEAVEALTPGTRAKEGVKRGRWCKKCEAVKPPRAHHCRQCGR
jgi:palmitoyltransferase